MELAEHGTPEVLDRIEEVLARAGVHRSASASKLGRVLADRIPPAPARPAARKDATAGEVVLAYLWEQADAIRAADPQIRRDAPDSVHGMRVACRRMRSTLQSFRTLLDRDRTDDLVAELRWLAGELGGARDLEVQEERIGRAVAALPPEIALGPVAAQTTRFFGRRRPTAGATASAALDSDRYLALLDAVDALLADPPSDRRRGRPGPAGAARAGREGAAARREDAARRGCATRRDTSTTSNCTRCARPPSGCATPPRSPTPALGTHAKRHGEAGQGGPGAAR